MALDGDQTDAPGCKNLPGEDPPERVVFEALRSANWLKVADRIKRAFSEVADACTQAMSLPEHHEWLRYAANKLVIGADTLWQVMCSEWATSCITKDEVKNIVEPVEDALNRILRTFATPQVLASARIEEKPKTGTVIPTDSSEPLLPFAQSLNGGQK